MVFELKSSEFHHCSSMSYSCGSLYCLCHYVIISKVCFYDSQSQNLCSVMLSQASFNFLNESSMDFCGQNDTKSCAWRQSAGQCSINSLNCTRCYEIDRESAGHFSYNPPKTEMKFSFFGSCGGVYVLGPYSPISNHYDCIFYNNTPSIALFVVWGGNHYLNHFLFIQNIKTISSVGHTNSFIGFINCIGDQQFVGVQNSLEGSTFTNQIVTEYKLYLHKCYHEMSIPMYLLRNTGFLLGLFSFCLCRFS